MDRMREDVSAIQRVSERTEKLQMDSQTAIIQRLSERMDKIQDDVALIVEMLQDKKREL